jgi:hypothetical protein
MKENGKWQIAFWVVTVGCFGLMITGFLTTAGYVVANDEKARLDRDKVEQRLLVKIETNQKELTGKLDKISVAIAKLETKIDND